MWVYRCDILENRIFVTILTTWKMLGNNSEILYKKSYTVLSSWSWLLSQTHVQFDLNCNHVYQELYLINNIINSNPPYFFCLETKENVFFFINLGTNDVHYLCQTLDLSIWWKYFWCYMYFFSCWVAHWDV